MKAQEVELQARASDVQVLEKEKVELDTKIKDLEDTVLEQSTKLEQVEAEMEGLEQVAGEMKAQVVELQARASDVQILQKEKSELDTKIKDLEEVSLLITSIAAARNDYSRTASRVQENYSRTASRVQKNYQGVALM